MHVTAGKAICHTNTQMTTIAATNVILARFSIRDVNETSENQDSKKSQSRE